MELPPIEASTIENRKEGAERVITFLEDSHLFDILNDAEKKKEVLRTITPEEAVGFLERINGLIIGLPGRYREAMSYSSNVKDTIKNEYIYLAPDTHIQEMAIEMVLEDIREMELNDAAVVVAATINLLHMFPEGNGRLGRVMHYLLVEPDEGMRLDDEEGIEHIRTVLTKRTMNCNPSYIKKEVDEIIKERIYAGDFYDGLDIHINPLPKSEVASPDVSFDSSEEDSDESLIKYMQNRAMIDSEDFNMGVLFYLSTYDDSFGKSATTIEDNKKICSIDVSSFIDTLKTSEQLQNMYLAYQTIKTTRIKIFSDMYKRPNMYSLKHNPEGNLKGLFEYRISTAGQAGLDPNILEMSG